MSIDDASKTIVYDCMGIVKGEIVLIIVDEKSTKIGESIYNVCKELDTEISLLKIRERKSHGEELPKFVAEAMKNVDVIIAPTTKSLSHTRARREACLAGARVASMPGITEEMMLRTLNADYEKIAILSKKFADILNTGNQVNLSSPAGTDIQFTLGDRKGIADTGILHNSGDFGNLPAGEAYAAPIEGSANGIVVFDGAVAGIDNIDEPIVIDVKDGNLIDISGGEAAEQFREIIYDVNDDTTKNLAELGIGTNEKARLSSSLLEVEKVINTVHIAFGDNASMGGNIESPVHIDGVITKPTLKIDNKTIIKEGKILI